MGRGGKHRVGSGWNILKWRWWARYHRWKMREEIDSDYQKWIQIIEGKDK
jgi:hypothetical protein